MLNSICQANSFHLSLTIFSFQCSYQKKNLIPWSACVIHIFLSLSLFFWPCWVFIAARRFSSCGEWWLLWLQCKLVAVASLVAKNRLKSTQTSEVVACEPLSCRSWALEHKLNCCCTQAQLLQGMWDLPGPGIKPVSHALAGRFFTTEPPGKPSLVSFVVVNFFIFILFWSTVD